MPLVEWRACIAASVHPLLIKLFAKVLQHNDDMSSAVACAAGCAFPVCTHALRLHKHAQLPRWSPALELLVAGCLQGHEQQR